MSRNLATLGIVLFLCACAAQHGAPGGGHDAAATGLRGAGNPCSDRAGSTDRNAPIVCVDDTGSALTVSPDPVRVNDVGAADRAPVMIHWHTVSGTNDLRLEIEPGCVTNTTCDGRGHCSARTVPRDDRSARRCKYDVWTDKHPRLDPDIIIEPCC